MRVHFVRSMLLWVYEFWTFGLGIKLHIGWKILDTKTWDQFELSSSSPFVFFFISSSFFLLLIIFFLYLVMMIINNKKILLLFLLLLLLIILLFACLLLLFVDVGIIIIIISSSSSYCTHARSWNFTSWMTLPPPFGHSPILRIARNE